MPRPARHSVDGMLDAARDLVLRCGARAVTVDAIVATSGAPKGSVYHRFATTDDLLASMWLRAVRRSQGLFLRALDAEGDPVKAAVAAGLAMHDFVRDEPADARLLAAVRREDLVSEVSDPRLAAALREVNRPLEEGLAAMARRLYGRATPGAVQRVACAVVDLPQGAIRRHLVAGVSVPESVRLQLTAAIHAALSSAAVRSQSMEERRNKRMSDEVAVVRRMFAAVEDRDLEGLLDCYHEDVEIHEAAVLPYGGVWRGREGATGHARAFAQAWAPFQGPDEARLDPSFCHDDAGTVTVLFRHRAVDHARGQRLDAAEVGVYQIRDGRVARSQMFHEDSDAVARFLREATSAEP